VSVSWTRPAPPSPPVAETPRPTRSPHRRNATSTTGAPDRYDEKGPEKAPWHTPAGPLSGRARYASPARRRFGRSEGATDSGKSPCAAPRAERPDAEGREWLPALTPRGETQRVTAHGAQPGPFDGSSIPLTHARVTVCRRRAGRTTERRRAAGWLFFEQRARRQTGCPAPAAARMNPQPPTQRTDGTRHDESRTTRSGSVAASADIGGQAPSLRSSPRNPGAGCCAASTKTRRRADEGAREAQPYRSRSSL